MEGKNSRSIVLVSCVKSKRASKSKAKDLYVSTLFRAQRAYAEKFADEWYILSAKYGLLKPDSVVDTYEETLKGAPVARKRAWSHDVFSKLKNVTSPNDVITITAGEDYCKYLVPLLADRGHKVVRPVKGLTMGFIPGKLYQLAAAPAARPVPRQKSRALTERKDFPFSYVGSGRQAIEDFYAFLSELGPPRRLNELENLPKRGVYFFFEEGEVRKDGRSPRVVRIGTHGLKPLSKSTLSGRLSQHRGTRSGSGNHRGSVFRKHVGNALILRNTFSCETWGQGSTAPRDVVLAEQFLEKKVSEHIGKMLVSLLEIPDDPGPNSARAFVERNSIGLLAGSEPASPNWLGTDSGNEIIARSFLWNVNHVNQQVEHSFFEQLKNLVRRKP